MAGRISAIFPHPPALSGKIRHPSSGKEKVSPQALHIVNWVVDCTDNQGMPFMTIDKVHARAIIFDASGQLQGAATALLGLARCDDFAPGIDQRKLSSIRLDEGTTPERRFVASRDLDGNGREMLWQKPW